MVLLLLYLWFTTFEMADPPPQDVIVEATTEFPEEIILENLKIFYSRYRPINLDKFRNKNLLAIVGIGNPNNFFQLIEKNGLNVKKKLIFPDHYEFTKTEIDNIKIEAKNSNCSIIMTEKDYFKIKKFNINEIEYLKVSLDIDEKEKFLDAIYKIYD